MLVYGSINKCNNERELLQIYKSARWHPMMLWSKMDLFQTSVFAETTQNLTLVLTWGFIYSPIKNEKKKIYSKKLVQSYSTVCFIWHR